MMKLKLLSALLLLSFVLMQSTANAQSQTQYFLPLPFPRSPSATGLEKYGTYKVNEFTGLPDISIPLYTIEAGGFQVPIALSYHASGVKVTEVASWVGMGWSVSAGGQISRKTMGLPDDIGNGYLNGLMRQPAALTTSTVDGVHYLENVANGTYDTKPDIYSYDFPGHGGKFFFDGRPGQNFVARTVPYAPLSIKYSLATTLNKFNIADEHGNNYVFGDGATDITYSSSGGRPGYNIPSAWKLKSMISQNRRDSIFFTYNTDRINYPALDGELFTVVDQVQILDAVCNYTPSYTTNPTTPGNASVVDEQLISQITFKNGKVVFELDPTIRADVDGTGGIHSYKLKDIKVYNYNYSTKVMEVQKTILFYQSYYNSTSSKRLMLDSIQVLDRAGSVVQHYNFDYNKTIAMPDYTSFSQDYWGYYNGKANNMLTPKQTIQYQPYTTSAISSVTINSAGITNGRDCDSNYMQSLVLTGIHFPTGGYSTFTYQTNQYYDSGTLKLAGGLRVKTINSYDGISSTPIVKNYVYNSARPNFQLDYSYFVNSQTHRFYDLRVHASPPPQCYGYEVVRTYSCNPHADLEGYDGAPVVYPSVTEYIGTPGTNVGRTDYTFTDQKDTTENASMSGNLIYSSMFYVRGHLASKKEYIHKADGSYQIVQSVNNSYSALPYKNYNNIGLAIGKINYNEGPVGTNPFEPAAGAQPDDSQSFTLVYPSYHILSDDNYLNGSTTKIYDANDTTKYTSSSVSYAYDDTTHQQIAYTTHTDSKGNTHISSNKYAYNYLNGGTTTNNAVLDSMINRHMFAEPMEKWENLQNATTGVNTVTSGQLNLYTQSWYNGGIVPSKISTLSVAQPLTNFTSSSVVSGNLTGDSRYVSMISFDQYDPYNNIIQYTPRNTTPVSVIWDYLHENPIAQVKNSTSINITYTSFEADGKGGWNYGGTPVFDPTAPTGSMVYPLSTGSISSPSMSTATGYVLSYWSNNGAASVYAGNYLSATPLRSSNGWSYYEYTVPAGVSSISISGSTSIDELRLYPVNAQMTTFAYNPSGVTAMADTKGATTYFEYDFFGRLKNAKDWNGNIVKNYGYHTFDQTAGNQVQTGTFTRNNCPSGTNPQSLTYTVPANKYYSSTLASANADATYDMNVNGQIKANQNCGCPVSQVSFTLTNYTGIGTFQVAFSGPYNHTYTFPSYGSTTIQVPSGTYTVQIYPTGDYSYHTFMLGSRSSVYAPGTTFYSVSITASNNETPLSIQ
jgi:hypothetical protein